MTRKMAYIGLSYIAGLFFASFFSYYIKIISISAIIIFAIAYFILFEKCKKQVLLTSLVFCIAVIVNIAYSGYVSSNILEFSGRTASFKGEVTEFKQYSNNKALYEIKGKINGNINANVLLYSTNIDIDYYDTIEFEGAFNEIQNSIAFPAKDYYNAKKVFLEVSQINTFSVYKSGSINPFKSIKQYRDYIFNIITKTLPGDEGAFLGAIICGDKSELDSSVKTQLYRVGIGHIIAVSGTHLMIISGIIYLLLSMIKTKKLYRFLIAEGVVILFTIFSGMSVSVIRSAIMFTILIFSDIIKRRSDSLTSIAFAGFVLTLFNPFAIRDASLLLSLSGTFGILVGAPFINSYFKNKGRFLYLRKALLSMLCVSLCTFPFVLLFFDEVSLISLISNIVLVPLCSLALICCFLVAITGGLALFANPLLLIAGSATKLVLYISKLFSKIPFTYIPLGYDFIIRTFTISAIAIIILVYVFRTKKALISAVLSSVLLLLISSAIYTVFNKDKLDIYYLTKNNSSVLILNNNSQACIIDIDGSSRIVDNVNMLLTSKGIDDVEVLFLNKNAQKSVSSYINTLNSKVDNVCFCSTEPAILPKSTKSSNLDEESTVILSDYQINLLDESTYQIIFYDYNIVLDFDDENFQDSDFNIRIANNATCFLNDTSTVMSLNNKEENVILINVSASGDFVIRGMTDALR